jgi:hypothetical protein
MARAWNADPQSDWHARGFTADVLWSNAAMLHVLERAAATVTVSRGHDSAEVVQLFA